MKIALTIINSTKLVIAVLVIGLMFSCRATAQSNSDQSQTNQTKTTRTPNSQTKIVKIPSGVKNGEYEPDSGENILLLTLSSDNRIFYQDKPLDDASLKSVLTQYSQKQKGNSSTTGAKRLPNPVKNLKSFYIMADANLPFSQILKVLKAVQASSPTSYRAKFIVNPEGQISAPENTLGGKYVVNINLGMPEKPNAVSRPNPLMLTAKLDASGKITLNSEPMDRSQFINTLSKVFKEREEYGAFEEGTNEIVKTITLYPAPDVKYGDVIKFIDELYGIYAKVEFGDLRNYKTPQVIEIR